MSWPPRTAAEACAASEPRSFGPDWRPKGRKWRTYFGYTPPSFRAAVKPRHNVEAAYRNFLDGNDPHFERANFATPIESKPARPIAHTYAPNVVPLRAPEPVSQPAVDDRRQDAAALLRELAGDYGPKRAGKMRAMADFIETEATRKAGAA